MQLYNNLYKSLCLCADLFLVRARANTGIRVGFMGDCLHLRSLVTLLVAALASHTWPM